MFNLSWTEMLVLGVVAVVVVGPKDLPQMMRTIGQWANHARRLAAHFRSSLGDMAREAELESLRSEVRKLTDDQTLTQVRREAEAVSHETTAALKGPHTT